jgi:hypothetical protein
MFGSIATLKFKDFHDSVVHAAILFKDTGNAGIVVRFMDPWNHYLFETNSQNVTIAKYIDGIRTVLATEPTITE